MLHSVRAALALLTAWTPLLAGCPARAAAEDYRFETAGQPARVGGATVIRFRLVHVADGKPIDGAVLFSPKLEMGEGAGAMTAPVKIAPASGPGTYAVQAQPGMAGAWLLSVAAKVPGETATVRGRIALDLAP
jgi:hypothetical protein